MEMNNIFYLYDGYKLQPDKIISKFKLSCFICNNNNNIRVGVLNKNEK